jgi:zinc protease
MLNLPPNYLGTYRDQVQQVTVDEIQRVAKAYIRPNEAALVVVGDGSAILEQIKPYCSDIEAYTTAGKRKEIGAPTNLSASDIVGDWSIEVETPLGQTIPATLSISREGSGLKATITSEMGNADLGTIELQNNGFHKATSLQMDGHSVDIEIAARFEGDDAEGTLTMQDSALPFSGGRAD